MNGTWDDHLDEATEARTENFHKLLIQFLSSVGLERLEELVTIGGEFLGFGFHHRLNEIQNNDTD